MNDTHIPTDSLLSQLRRFHQKHGRALQNRDRARSHKVYKKWNKVALKYTIKSIKIGARNKPSLWEIAFRLYDEISQDQGKEVNYESN